MARGDSAGEASPFSRLNDDAHKDIELPSMRALSTLMDKVGSDPTLSRVARAEAAAMLDEHGGHVGKAFNRLRVVHDSAAAEAAAASPSSAGGQERI